MQPDYFAILEITAGASEQEIRSAYRRLARRYHPDLHPERGDGEQRLKELNEAYAVLSDPRQRAHYLRTRRVRIPVDAAPNAPPATPRRPAPAPPPSPPPPPPYGPYASHVDLTGGRARRGAHRPRGSELGARHAGPARPRPLDDEELALLYARRLLRMLFGW